LVFIFVTLRNRATQTDRKMGWPVVKIVDLLYKRIDLRRVTNDTL